MGLAGARPAAGLIVGFVIAQGFALASGQSRFKNSNSAPPASADEGALVSTDKPLYPLGETIVVQVSNSVSALHESPTVGRQQVGKESAGEPFAKRDQRQQSPRADR
jgi:hypothetical protein